ncbi:MULTISPECIES: DUF3027 domain-containing protein [Microbacterium]|uniref:DUF3027 domain-containing protein n=1 Tax=Microbacterium TaxID=33882 RepID=UPI00278513AB|nr:MULTISPECIES: DUF3027 domain-containing protein [Microbacterium]MDQ1084599.1 hypothetical protein [Microbacterium sp. SORGH_AS_0344]MDQ1170124.1 hypothetical protein [Microbacterium proteolyticum]
MTSKPEQVADERLTGAHDLALAALHEITPADTVGPAAGYTPEDDGVVSLRFHTRLSGYPGWFWTVSVAVVDDAEPTVLEAELLPGDGALLAPDWVPWATRLAEYHAAQAAAVADDEEDDLDDDVDDDDADHDDDGPDDDEEDEEPKARFHAGDLDGVDIDELDADRADESEDDEGDLDDDDEIDLDEDRDEGDRSY